MSNVSSLHNRAREEAPVARIHPAVHKAEMDAPAAGFRTRTRFGKLLGGSTAMQRLYDRIEDVAPKAASALIAGESGSGKDLVAHALHVLGPRRGELFLPVKCAAV